MAQIGRVLDTTLLSERVLKLRASFQSRIVGQTNAVDALTNALEKHLGGFADSRRPIANLLFLGPTGTGKTSCVEALCEGLFGFQDAMIKIDCAEFQHSHEIAKLLGSPPGYLGHRETNPRLTQEALNKYWTVEMPISVILFDEIEKASDAMWHLLLNILDKGLVTLGDGRITNFTKTIIIMTSNVGAKEMDSITGDGQLGFQPKDMPINHRDLKEVSMSAARRKFTPEFLNRMDEIVHFKTLSEEQVYEIIGLELSKLQARLFIANSSNLTPSPAAIKEIFKQGFSTRYNARNIRRVIEKLIMTPISRALATKQLHGGENVVVDFKDEQFQFYGMGVPNGFIGKASDSLLQP